MTIEDLQSICKDFNSVTTDIKWEDHLCFNIGEKIFLITSPDTLPLQKEMGSARPDTLQSVNG